MSKPGPHPILFTKGKRYCPKTHDTWKVGRKKGECAECRRERERYANMTPMRALKEMMRKDMHQRIRRTDVQEERLYQVGLTPINLEEILSEDK